MSIVRQKSVTVQVGEGQRSIVLKQWSMAKMFFLIREFWSLIEEGLGLIQGEKITEAEMIKVFVNQLLQCEDKARDLIKHSLQNGKDSGLADDEILELYPDDFLLLLTEVVEMNFNEALVKNFQSLLTTFKKKTNRGEKKTDKATSSV